MGFSCQATGRMNGNEPGYYAMKPLDKINLGLGKGDLGGGVEGNEERGRRQGMTKVEEEERGSCGVNSSEERHCGVCFVFLGDFHNTRIPRARTNSHRITACTSDDPLQTHLHLST